MGVTSFRHLELFSQQGIGHEKVPETEGGTTLFRVSFPEDLREFNGVDTLSRISRMSRVFLLLRDGVAGDRREPDSLGRSIS